MRRRDSYLCYPERRGATGSELVSIAFMRRRDSYSQDAATSKQLNNVVSIAFMRRRDSYECHQAISLNTDRVSIAFMRRRDSYCTSF